MLKLKEYCQWYSEVEYQGEMMKVREWPLSNEEVTYWSLESKSHKVNIELYEDKMKLVQCWIDDEVKSLLKAFREGQDNLYYEFLGEGYEANQFVPKIRDGWCGVSFFIYDECHDNDIKVQIDENLGYVQYTYWFDEEESEG